jgi:hypothetical protein
MEAQAAQPAWAVPVCYAVGTFVAVAFATYAFVYGSWWTRKMAGKQSTEDFITARGTQNIWRIGWSFYAGAVGAWVIVAPSQVRHSLLGRSSCCIRDCSSSNMTAATAEAAVLLARPCLQCVRAIYALFCCLDAAVPCHTMHNTSYVSGLVLCQAHVQLQLLAVLQDSIWCSFVSCLMPAQLLFSL